MMPTCDAVGAADAVGLGSRGTPEPPRFAFPVHPMTARTRLVAGGLLLVAFGVVCATRSVDFPVYHRVAVQMLSGNYELYPTAVYAGGDIPAHGFRYAPAIAFVFLPFGLLPLGAAAFLFFVLKVAALVYVSAVVARHAGLPATDRVWIWVAMLAVGGYLIEEFRYGNFHFFCLALLVAAFDAAESGGVFAPAAALGVAIAAKLTPILLLPYFALRRRFAACAATAGVLLVIAALPIGVVGWDMNRHLLDGFARYAVQKIGEDDNYSLRGVLFKYVAPDYGAQTATAIWLASLVVASLVVAAVLRRTSSSRTIRLLEFSIVLTAMLLASPHTQRRYFVTLYVPVLALLALSRASSTHTEVRAAQLAVAVTAATGTVLPLVFGGRRLSAAYEATSPYFFGTVVLFSALLYITVRLKAAESIGRVALRAGGLLEQRFAAGDAVPFVLQESGGPDRQAAGPSSAGRRQTASARHGRIERPHEGNNNSRSGNRSPGDP